MPFLTVKYCIVYTEYITKEHPLYLYEYIYLKLVFIAFPEKEKNILKILHYVLYRKDKKHEKIVNNA